MVQISPDVGRNRLIIKLSGRPGRSHSLEAEQQLDAALARLVAPVDVLSDIRELESMEDFHLEDFVRLSKRLGRFGTRKVVRIVGKSALAAVHLERLSRHLNGHAAHLAFSLAEAEQVFGNGRK